MAITTFFGHAAEAAKQENTSLNEMLERLKGIGIKKYEVISGVMDDMSETVAQEFSKAEVQASSLCAFFDFLGDDIDAQIDKMLGYADKLKVERVLIIPGFYENGDSVELKGEKDKKILEGVSRFVEKAGENGIYSMMEPFDNLLSPIHTAAGLKRYVESNPGLSYTFDTGNFAYADEDEEKAYDLLRGRIKLVHLKDRAINKPECGGEPLVTVGGKTLYPAPVGGGIIKMDKIITRLKEDGYNGDYAIEHFGTPKQLEYLENSVSWMKAHI